MSLQNAMLWLNGQIGALTEIKSAPDYPPESSSAFPFSLVYPSTGSLQYETNLVFRGVHTFILEIHFNRSILPTAVSTLLPLIKSISEVIRQNPTLNGEVDTVIATDGQPLTYQVLSTDYAEVDTIALQFSVSVKVHDF